MAQAVIRTCEGIFLARDLAINFPNLAVEHRPVLNIMITCEARIDARQ